MITPHPLLLPEGEGTFKRAIPEGGCRSRGALPQHPGHRPEHGPAVQPEGAGAQGEDGVVGGGGSALYTHLLSRLTHPNVTPSGPSEIGLNVGQPKL